MEKVLTGLEFDELAAVEKTEAVSVMSVFARVEPSHKTRLVELLQAQVKHFTPCSYMVSCVKIKYFKRLVHVGMRAAYEGLWSGSPAIRPECVLHAQIRLCDVAIKQLCPKLLHWGSIPTYVHIQGNVCMCTCTSLFLHAC